MKNQPITPKAADAVQSAFTKRDLGCIIDESAGSADDLNRRTIDFAKEHGFECDPLYAFKTETFKLPAYWAGYLINGDASGLEDDEQAECDAFLEARSLPSPSDVGESYFSHRNDAGTLAGDVADYTFIFDEEDEEYSQSLSESADDAVDYLNGLELPSYCSFYFEDNSLFLAPCLENAKEDVGFVSGGEDSDPKDSDYPAADYRGEWMHISDHGNVTLYVRGEDGKDAEIWSVV